MIRLAVFVHVVIRHQIVADSNSTITAVGAEIILQEHIERDLVLAIREIRPILGDDAGGSQLRVVFVTLVSFVDNSAFEKWEKF